jgi:hypothetical protein
MGLATTGSAGAAGTVVALWHMDETTGATTMHDSSGNNNNGSLINVITGLPDASCHLHSCYSFQRTPSVAVVPHSNTLNPGTQDITLTEWVNTGVIPPPAVGDYDMIRKGLGSATGGDYKMEVKPRNQGTAAKLLCLFQDSAGKEGQLIKGPNLADNKWHQVQCRRTATNIQAIVDGRVWTKSIAIGSISNTEDVTVGARSPQGGDQYTGLMDEVSITIGG